jgi:hypothetical protein
VRFTNLFGGREAGLGFMEVERIGAVEVFENDIDDEAGRGLEVGLSLCDEIVDIRRSHEGFASPDPLNSICEPVSSNPGVDALVEPLLECSELGNAVPSCIPNPSNSIFDDCGLELAICWLEGRTDSLSNGGV